MKKSHFLKRIMLCVAVIIFLAIGLCAALYQWNDFRLILQASDGENVIVEYGTEYSEPEIQIKLAGSAIIPMEWILHDVVPEKTGEVCTDAIGSYTVTYSARFHTWEGTLERSVLVIDSECPQIILEEGPEDPLMPGETYEEPGYRATDNVDGDITHRVIRQEGEGEITYAVVDSSGNPAYAKREIPYYDPIPPEIVLEGDVASVITVGTVFLEPGYHATDNADGDLTEAVVVEGEVDWLTPGVYPITYHVTDSFLNRTEVTRTVEVQALPWPDTQWPEQKTIYLTFDDGPGPYTPALLDVLDKYNVKATFFVVDSDYRYLMQEMVARGHSIGIHSVTHDYAQIYANPQAYFEDLFAMQDIIYECTGVKTTLLRFPGGGSNLVSKGTCEGIMSILTWAVRDAGFQYFDWNVDSEDAGGATKTDQVRDNVIRGIRETGTCIVLQHDIHGYSVAAVEEIIVWGLENGYTFLPIRESTPGFHHDVLN